MFLGAKTCFLLIFYAFCGSILCIMNLCERIRYICSQEDLSVAGLERLCGCGRGKLNSVIRQGRNSMQSSYLESILRVLPRYDAFWLLTGEGSPERSQAVVSEISNPRLLRGTVFKPHYAVDFLAGFRENFSHESVSSDEMICFPAFRSADFWVDVTGRAMEPVICHGDIVAVRRLDPWLGNVLFGEAYIVVTDQNRVVRRIRKGGEGCLLLVADNPDYDSFEIPEVSVLGVYKILASVRKVF